MHTIVILIRRIELGRHFDSALHIDVHGHCRHLHVYVHVGVVHVIIGVYGVVAGVGVGVERVRIYPE